jgi:hypothetical protein
MDKCRGTPVPPQALTEAATKKLSNQGCLGLFVGRKVQGCESATFSFAHATTMPFTHKCTPWCSDLHHRPGILWTMRVLLVLWVLVSCTGPGFVTGAADNQEYIFVLNSGRSFMRVLPTDWHPVYEGAFMRIDPRHRVLGQDVILIHPRFPINPHELEQVRVLRRFASSAAADHLLWVYPGQDLRVGQLDADALVQVGPQTWIRSNEFRLEFRRPMDR